MTSLTSQDKKYTARMFWRETHEKKAFFCWLIVSFVCFGFPFFVDVSPKPYFLASFFSLAMSLKWAYPFYKHVKLIKSFFKSEKVEVYTAEEYYKKAKEHAMKGEFWLGKGFRWGMEEAQMAHDIKEYGFDEITEESSDDDEAAPWIHRVGDDVKDVTIKMDVALERHMMTSGTTGVGKTKISILELYHVIAARDKEGRPNCVVVLDPKGDESLAAHLHQAAILDGRGEDFLYLHSGFKDESIRLDPLANWSRSTEIANRIKKLLPKGGNSEAFTAYQWMVIDNITNALLYINERPSFVKLLHYVTVGFIDLTFDCFNHLAKTSDDADINGKWGQLRRDNRSNTVINDEFYDYIKQQSFEIPMQVESIYQMAVSNQDYIQKMTGSLKPILTQLTASPLAELLSPDYEDYEDYRPIYNLSEIVKERKIIYVGLDMLSDEVVGGALGSIILSELASVSGQIYNYEKKAPTVLFADEVAEILNSSLIQLLNKGRGSGMSVILATQVVFADLEEKLGSASAARQVLGNINTLLSMKLEDVQAIDLLNEKFGTTSVKSRLTQRSDHTDTSKGATDISVGVVERMNKEEVDLVTKQIWQKLPKFEYFMKTPAGRIYKGRFPLVEDKDALVNGAKENQAWLKNRKIERV